MAGGVGVTIGGEALSDIPNRVSHISISRGRQDELDRTGTGTCTVSLNYISGGISDFIGTEGSVFLNNPLGGGSAIFSGIVDEVLFDFDRSQKVTRCDVTIVDALDFFAGIELAPGINGEVPLPDGVDTGNIFYEQAIPQDRINQCVLESGFAGPTEIFTGNVQVKDTVYSPRTSMLTVIHDAADAEFPGVANVFVQRDGTFTFHGRLARFNPGDGQYHISTYNAGDRAAGMGDASYAQIRGLQMGSSRQRVINAAMALPEGIADVDIEAQIVTDAWSIDKYGLRSWSAENLLTFYDELNDLEANAATKQFATYYVEHYYAPQVRVEELMLRSIRPSHSRASATWNLLCNADISDIVHLKVTNPGIAVDVDFFVEGVRYEIGPTGANYADVTMMLDLSPRALWTTSF